MVNNNAIIIIKCTYIAQNTLNAIGAVKSKLISQLNTN